MTDAREAPSPDGLPLVGHAYGYTRDPLGFVERTVESHGGVVSLSMPGYDVVLLANPTAIEHVLVHNHENYCKGEFQRKELEGLLGDGILISEGDRWKEQHERIQPAFYPGQIAKYADVMTERTEEYLNRWENRDSLVLTESLPELTLDILGSVLFDTDLREATEVREAAIAVTERFEPDPRIPVHIPDWVPTPRNRRYLRAVSRLESFVVELIESRRTRDDGGKTEERRDLLSALVESKMSDTEIRDQLITFLIAGHETTALALTYTLYLLGNHRDEQARVAEEVSQLDGLATIGDDLPRTDRTIREAVRLYPPVSLLMREAIRDDIVGGYEIPEGALVLCSQWATHRRRKFYDDPESFRPARWTADKNRPDYAYFAFGGGQRQCIGRRFALLEARLILASLVKRFRVRTVSPRKLDLVAAMTLAPATPVEVELRSRMK